jgi:hypothetical protein
MVISLIFCGCYTQLLRRSSTRGSGVVQDTSSGYSQRSTGCNCSPWEIQNNLCWCVCDRCGYYHRLGYRYCAHSWYRSYWGWDYYSEYPWWYSRYDRYRRRHGYYDGHYYHGGYSGSSGGTIEVKPKKKIKRKRGIIYPNPAEPLNKPSNSTNQSSGSSSPSSPSPQSTTISAPGSSGSSSSTPSTDKPEAHSKKKVKRKRGKVDE